MHTLKLLITCLLIQMLPVIVRAQTLDQQLIVSVRKSNVADVRSLLGKGASPNAKGEYDRTALSYACDRGNIEIVRILLDAGADFKLRDSFYKAPPINWAVIKDHGDIVKLMIQRGAGDKGEVMSSAILQKKKNTVKSLLELGGFSPDALSDYLASAEQNDASDIAELLKAAGAKAKSKVEYKVEAEALKAYEGVFKSGAMEFAFQAREGKLHGTVNGFEFDLVPVEKDVFESRSAMKVVAVFSQEGGQVASVTVKGPAGQLVAKKVETKQK